MSTRSSSPPGTTRICPHCRTTILESSAVCPQCKHYLRFAESEGPGRKASGEPLRIEGTVRHTAGGEAWEYSVLVTITDQKGEEVGRHLVGVGALAPGELRHVTLSVEVQAPGDRVVPVGQDGPATRDNIPRG